MIPQLQLLGRGMILSVSLTRNVKTYLDQLFPVSRTEVPSRVARSAGGSSDDAVRWIYRYDSDCKSRIEIDSSNVAPHSDFWLAKYSKSSISPVRGLMREASLCQRQSAQESLSNSQICMHITSMPLKITNASSPSCRTEAVTFLLRRTTTQSVLCEYLTSAAKVIR